MHKLYEAVTCKIDEIVCKGITGSNLKYLGELVDIKKDIENIWYWKAKKAEMAHSDGDVCMLIADKVKSVSEMHERYSNSMSAVDKMKLHEAENELVEAADMIRDALSMVSSDDEIMTHVKRVFK